MRRSAYNSWATEWKCDLQGWEEFDEPVDRIVTIGAFEHFREERYADLFEKTFRLLAPGASILVRCIVFPEDDLFEQLGIPITAEDVAFLEFITKEIFPGGQLRAPSVICRYARAAGFEVTRLHSLQRHYALTLDCWAHNLRTNRESAIRLTSERVYDTYMRYLAGCADHFRGGKTDLIQFSLLKPSRSRSEI
jgi:cyclopropane-fatty-acyl-phospholipid synthase